MSDSDSDQTSLNFVVLGSTGAIGSELSQRLVNSGHQVMLGGRDQKSLSDLAHQLRSPAQSVDASESGSIDACLQKALEEFGYINGIVNCIGSVLLKPAHLTSDEEWSQTIAINLTSAFETVRSGARMMGRSGGTIVLVSSAAARLGIANHEAIAAAKAGVIGLTLSSAATYANRGIRVNAVAPGLIKSKMTQRLWENAAAETSSIAMHALDRLGEPSDVASMIEWLLQPANNWITGQILGVDGGLATIVPRTRQSKK